MATDKPRITITLTAEQYALLDRLSTLQKAPKARIVSEMLGEVFPILEKVAEALELAQRASQTARANFVRAATEAEEELRPLAKLAKDQFDMFAQQLGTLVAGESEPGAAEAATGDVAELNIAGADSGALSPRPVITGATPVTKVPRSPRKSPRSIPGKPLSRKAERAI